MSRYDKRQPYWRDEEYEPEFEEFAKHHRSFSDRVERLLMQLIILGLVVLVLVQTLHMNTAFRRVANVVDGLEGIPWEQVTAWSGRLSQDGYGVETNTDGLAQGRAAVPVSGQPTGLTLTVSLMNHRTAPYARLLVDGQAAGDFSSGRLTVAVTPGQILVVDGIRIPEPMQFRVIASDGVATPPLGHSVTTRGDRQTLGVVRSFD